MARGRCAELDSLQRHSRRPLLLDLVELPLHIIEPAAQLGPAAQSANSFLSTDTSAHNSRAPLCVFSMRAITVAIAPTPSFTNFAIGSDIIFSEATHTIKGQKTFGGI
jgi:hypothetical protein